MLQKWFWCECGKRWADFAPLILRLAVGSVLVMHGYGKLTNLEGTAGFFGSLGIPDPSLFALLVGCIEFFGGLALFVGFMTHWASKFAGIVLIFAFLLVHMEKGWSDSEFVLTLLAGTVALGILGAGKYSLDRLLEERGIKPRQP